MVGALVVAGCGVGSSPSAAGAGASPVAVSVAPAATPGTSAGPVGSGIPSGYAVPSAAAAPSPSGAPAATPAPTPTPRFTLASSAFRPGGQIPARFTCDGADVSPAMSWTGTPGGTKALALIVDDVDASGFAHWIAFAIPPGTTGLAEGAGASRSSLVQGTNDFGRVGYGGPCPPSGTHRYVFTLYALAGPLGLDGEPRAGLVRSALARTRVLGSASVTATYSRGG